MSARYIVADVFDGLASLEENSVDLIFSSPPFLALRSYLPADHELKGKEIGSEATPADFLDTLLDVVEACDRVLAPHGSLCFELGDTFSGSGGAGGDYVNAGMRDGQPKFDGSSARNRGLVRAEEYDGGGSDHHDFAKPGTKSRAASGQGWPLDKSLCLIPTLFAASLAYGYNMLRPERTTPRWRVRNLVVWARPNPPVGALGDKFRPATSYVTVACKSGKRYFDLDAVRHPSVNPIGVGVRPTNARVNGTGEGGEWGHGMGPFTAEMQSAGAPPLDYWVIPTHPYPGSHYATFPPDLVVKPVKSMCPIRVCRVCGEPSRRIVEVGELEATESARMVAWDRGKQDDGTPDGMAAALKAGGFVPNHVKPRETLGWTDCGHDDYRAGCVLDPFAGSGTTLAVATGHGRDAIGIDLDARNAELALERVGPMFLTVETLTVEGAA